MARLKTNAARTALHIARENVSLLDRKQLDYGSTNISDFGYPGVVIRLNDKVQRLKHLLAMSASLKEADSAPQNESIEDTLRDISNYAIIGIMVRNGTWPRR